MKVKIAFGENIPALEKDINELIETGYQPYGNPWSMANDGFEIHCLMMQKVVTP